MSEKANKQIETLRERILERCIFIVSNDKAGTDGANVKSYLFALMALDQVQIGQMIKVSSASAIADDSEWTDNLN